MAWGSLGAGLIMAMLALLSGAAGIHILLPPLAASCFITVSCAYLRVARPKSVIVGHCVSALAGLFGLWIGGLPPLPEAWALPLKLVISLVLASSLMQLLDADHPPAAATAVLPIFIPQEAAVAFLPLHMAWGATLAICLSMAWNRMRFEFPSADEDCDQRYGGLFLPREQFWGLCGCVAGALLMLCRALSSSLYGVGCLFMLAGVLLLGTHHLPAALRKARRKARRRRAMGASLPHR